MAKERYELEVKIGVGGMGEVWLARDTLLDRPVAVKFLQSVDKEMYRDLFLSEARTLASLQHPNITLIYDAVFDESANRFYIMMEYVKGQPLSAIIAQHDGPLPFERVLEIAGAVCSALQYAHQKGFVHRDIKPENIIIQPDGVLKLTDFGLAALISILAEQDSDYIVGTPAYMSPEQIAGEVVDGRADLYALGVMLFELVTGGRRPFEYANQQDLLTAHIEEEPPSVREFVSSVPVKMERIIARLLAKYPEDRYASAGELLDAFTAMQARQKFSHGYLDLLTASAKPLVERERELARLNSLWAEVQSTGISRLVLVEGGPGMGKTRLVAEFLGNSVVDSGQVAAVGRCDEVGAAYTPYAEILATIFDRGLVKPSTLQNRLNYLIDQIPSLAPLLHLEKPAASPDNLSRTPGAGLWQTLSQRLPHAADQTPAQTQWEFFNTVLTILTELGPTVIFLDEAHHLDAASVALTRYLVSQRQLSLLIVAEVRGAGGEPGWVGTLSAEAIERIQPPPLSIKGVKTHLTNLLAGNVSDALVRVVDKRSRGNPLQVEEITRQLVDKGDFYQTDTGQWEYLPPPGSGSLSQNLVSPLLANAFTRQLEKLSPESRARLTMAALLESGPEFDFGLWVEALGGEPERAAAQAVIAEATQRRILREVEDGRRYAFRQADVSKALVAELSPEERRQRHRQIAALCVNRGNVPLLAAYHLEQAGQATQSAQYLEGAGQKAASENNLGLAVDCYNRAVNLVPTVAGYGALGRLYRQLGAWEESRAAFKQALDLAVQEGEVEQQARILNGLAFTLWLSDNYREAGEVASAVLKLRPVSAVEQATAQSHLGMISWLRGYLAEAEEWCRRAVMGLLSSGEDDRLAEAYNRLGLVYYTTGQLSQATQAAQLSLQLRQKLRQQWGEGYSLVNLGQIEAEQGHFAEAAQFFSQARTLFEALTSSDGLMVVDMEEGRSLLLQGNVNDAVLLLGRSLHGAREMKKRTAFGLGDINLLVAEAALRLNDLERAKSAVTEALALVESAGNRKSVALGQAIRARIYAAEGQPAQAESMFTQAIAQFTDMGYPAGLLRTQLQYAQFLAGQGRAEAAAQLQSQAQTEARRLSLYV